MSTANNGSLCFLEDNETVYHVHDVNLQDFNNSIESLYDYEYVDSLLKMIIKNNEELEKYLTSLEMEKCEDILSGQRGKDVQSEIQRLFLNIVNSHRCLEDTVPHTFSRNKRKGEEKLFKKLLSYHYDNRNGYKTFAILRNYTQHRSLIPISVVKLAEQDGVAEIQIKIEKKVLGEDKKVRGKFRQEIESNEDLDFIKLFKCWVVSCNEIQQCILDIFSFIGLSESNRLMKYNKPFRDLEGRLTLLSRDKDSGQVSEYYLPVGSAVEVFKRVFLDDGFKERVTWLKSL